jgi:hypothetical protein
MNPMLLCLCIAILVGVVQHLFSDRRRSNVHANEMRRNTIGVILVAPPGAEVEDRLTTMLHAAMRPECIRFYVAKLCATTDDVPTLSGARIRLCTRIHYVRSTRNSAQRLRARLIQEVVERYVLCLAWDHEVELGWDETLIGMHEACGNTNPYPIMLTTRLAPLEKGPTFLAVSAFDGNRMKLSSYAFAMPSKRPMPTIAMSAQLAFAQLHDARGAWGDADVLKGKGVDEDATLTVSLWMAGVDFFTPHHTPFVLATGTAERAETDGQFVWAKHAGGRNRVELLTALGVRRGKATSRAKAGLTQTATAEERFHKLGQSIRMHRDI